MLMFHTLLRTVVRTAAVLVSGRVPAKHRIDNAAFAMIVDWYRMTFASCVPPPPLNRHRGGEMSDRQPRRVYYRAETFYCTAPARCGLSCATGPDCVGHAARGMAAAPSIIAN